jgi:DNA-binding transcriptional ArsR family regulator
MLKVRALERIVKSFGNKRRIQILDLLEKKPESSVTEIARELKMSLKLASLHIRQLTRSGLVMKRSQGKQIRHKITRRGTYILTFLRTLE